MGIAGVFVLAWSLVYLLGWLYYWRTNGRPKDLQKAPTSRFWDTLFRIVGAVYAGAELGLLVFLIACFIVGENGPNRPALTYLTSTVLVPPLVVAALLLTITAQIGLSGRAIRESVREWWSRVGGVLAKSALLWLAFMGVAIFGPYGVEAAGAWASLGGLAWLGTTLAGVIAGHSAATDGTGRTALAWLSRIAPYMFLLGLLLVLSSVIYGTAIWTLSPLPPVPVVCQPEEVTASHDYRIVEDVKAIPSPLEMWTVARLEKIGGCSLTRYADNAKLFLLEYWNLVGMAIAFIVMALQAWLYGWRVDINAFALHMFYRNRLERCYLGASQPERHGHGWTDLDPADSPKLEDLKLTPILDGKRLLGQRPYPLINTALNLTHAENLAWQERQSASFVFTPDYCGYQYDILCRPGMTVGGYQRTDQYVATSGGEIPLSQAMTISGAALSPNSGYHTNPATAALMTVFNARLGWWMQNTRKPQEWSTPGPTQALSYLMREVPVPPMTNRPSSISAMVGTSRTWVCTNW